MFTSDLKPSITLQISQLNKCFVFFNVFTYILQKITPINYTFLNLHKIWNNMTILK